MSGELENAVAPEVNIASQGDADRYVRSLSADDFKSLQQQILGISVGEKAPDPVTPPADEPPKNIEKPIEEKPAEEKPADSEQTEDNSSPFDLNDEEMQNASPKHLAIIDEYLRLSQELEDLKSSAGTAIPDDIKALLDDPIVKSRREAAAYGIDALIPSEFDVNAYINSQISEISKFLIDSVNDEEDPTESFKLLLTNLAKSVAAEVNVRSTAKIKLEAERSKQELERQYAYDRAVSDALGTTEPIISRSSDGTIALNDKHPHIDFLRWVGKESGLTDEFLLKPDGFKQAKILYDAQKNGGVDQTRVAATKSAIDRLKEQRQKFIAARQAATFTGKDGGQRITPEGTYLGYSIPELKANPGKLETFFNQVVRPKGLAEQQKFFEIFG